MARYAPTHQLELTEEIVPLDDPPDAAETKRPDAPEAADHKGDAKAVVAPAEPTEPGPRVIEPPDQSGATAASTPDFNAITDGELNDRADRVPPNAPAAPSGDDDTENGAAARPATAQLAGEAATERWDSGGPTPWPQPLTARHWPHARGRARALAVGLLGAGVTVLAVVVVTGHDSGKPRESRADLVTRTESRSSPRTPLHTPTQAPQRSPLHRRPARAPHRHPHHRRYQRPHRHRRPERHRHQAQSSAPAPTSSPAPTPTPAAPSPPPSAARSGGGTTSGSATSSGGSSSRAGSSGGGGSSSGGRSSGGGGSAADPTFAGGF
jgi:uncharacterized membrane protein YgcG